MSLATHLEGQQKSCLFGKFDHETQTAFLCGEAHPTDAQEKRKTQFTLFKIHPPKALSVVASVFQVECLYSDFWCVLKNSYRML